MIRKDMYVKSDCCVHDNASVGAPRAACICMVSWCGGTCNRLCVRGQGGLRVGGAVTLAELVDLLGGADGRGSDVQSNIAAHMSRIAGAGETPCTPYQCGTSGSLNPQSKVALDVCCIHPPPLMCRALPVRPAPLPPRSPPLRIFCRDRCTVSGPRLQLTWAKGGTCL